MVADSDGTRRFHVGTGDGRLTGARKLVVGLAGAGVLTLSGFPKNATASATGTAAAARIRTGGTDIITGLTVGTSGADVILDSVSITSGQTVTLNSAVITHAA